MFSNHEKIRIAKLLDEVGVHQIEVGIPAMGGDEKKTIKQIVELGLDTSILAWNRAVMDDVQHSIDCGVDAVAISMSASDIHIEHKLPKSRQWVLDQIRECVAFAKDHDLYVSVNAEDASRADLEFLLRFGQAAKEEGADRLRFCDTLGILDPFDTYNVITFLKKEGGSTSRCTRTTTSAWRRPTPWPASRPAPPTSTPPSTASASAPATPRSRRS